MSGSLALIQKLSNYYSPASAGRNDGQCYGVYVERMIPPEAGLVLRMPEKQPKLPFNLAGARSVMPTTARGRTRSGKAEMN